MSPEVYKKVNLGVALIALLFLTIFVLAGCSRPQPPGQDLWRIQT